MYPECNLKNKTDAHVYVRVYVPPTKFKHVEQYQRNFVHRHAKYPQGRLWHFYNTDVVGVKFQPVSSW